MTGESEKIAVGTAAPANAAGEAKADPLAGARVLVAEDEADLLDVLVQLFAHAGADAHGVEDGAVALAAFRVAEAHGEPFDLVVLDVMMPRMNGFEVCGAIREASDVPIMVLTALSAEDDQLTAFGLMADDYVTKPFSLPVVLERARALLRRARGRAQAAAPANAGGAPSSAIESAAVLRNGGLSIDLDSRTVDRDGREADLTRTEFDVLVALYAHPGRVLSREALVEKAQGYAWAGDANAIKLHVMNIRRKLGDDVIETVRGVGYRAPRQLS